MASALGSVAIVAGAEQVCVVPRSDAHPVLDGECETCWERSFPVTDFYEPFALRPAEEKTEVRFLQDGETLYGFVTCQKKGNGLITKGSSRHDDSGIWAGHAIEMFFLGEDGLRHFMFSPAGGVYDARGHEDEAYNWVMDAAWESDIKIAFADDPKSWRFEFALPVKALPGRKLQFNVARDYPRGVGASSWARLDSPGWLPKDGSRTKFGRLHLLDTEFPEADAFVLPEPVGKDHRVTVRREGRIFYDVTSPEVHCHLSVQPYNLKRGVLYLNGNQGIDADISWNSKHNYPNGDQANGGRVKIPVTLVFEVPSGIVPKKAVKTGSVEREGKMYDVYEQKEPFAYNYHSWMGSAFTCSLPAGPAGMLRYAVRYPDGEQPFREIPCEVVDIPETARLKSFTTGFYGLFIRNVEQAREWAKSGVNTFSVRGYDEGQRKLARELKAAGFRIRRGDYFWPGSCPASSPWQDWSAQDETARAIDVNGKPIAQGRGYQLSPAYRGRMLDAAIAKEMNFCRGLDFDAFCFDIENYAQCEGEAGDFRSETIAAFRTHWEKTHPSTPVPDPFVFEKDRAAALAHPEAHACWVETKCDLWAGFFETIKDRFEQALGKRPVFTEWSMNTFDTVEGRNHSLRNGRFYRVFDAMEIDSYAGIDRMLRQLETNRRRFSAAFGGQTFQVIMTPSPVRLGFKSSPSDYYYSSAPAFPDEGKYTFMEAATLGVKGVYAFTASESDILYLSEFAKGVNLVAKAEDVVMNGTSRDLKTNFSEDAEIRDNFFGKSQVWKDQKRVFARANTLGKRTLVSVSEYRTLADMTVEVDFPHANEVTCTDLETGEKTVLKAGEPKLVIRLPKERRCRLFLFE